MRGIADVPARILRSRALPWTLAVLLLAAAAGFGVLWRRAEAERSRRHDVEMAVRAFLVALTNFKASTIERDVEEMRRFAVGDFADQLDESFDQEAIASIKRAKARSVGKVESVFIQSIAGGTASAFGVVDERVTNNLRKQPRMDVLRLDIQLIETADGWKVSSVRILQTPGAMPLPGA